MYWVLWKEVTEEGRWRRKQEEDFELGYPESRWRKYSYPKERAVVLSMTGCVLMGMEF